MIVNLPTAWPEKPGSGECFLVVGALGGPSRLAPMGTAFEPSPRQLACACVGLKSGKARTNLQHRLPAETGREPGESRESNKTRVEQGDMQRKQLTGHASKRVYDWQSGMAHWGETQRYGSMGWPNGSAER